MKKICFVLLLGYVFFSGELWAEVAPQEAPSREGQNADSEYLDTLYLPELTTIINGESWSVAEEAVPSYQVHLPEPPTEEGIVPVEVPSEPPLSDLPPSVVELASRKAEKDFFVRGFIAPAWPFSLDTEFSISTTEPESFFLDFGYKVVGGYGLEQVEDGFFHNKSFLQVGKSLLLGNVALKIQGNYKSLDNGLQGQSLLFDDINRRGAGVGLEVQLPLGHGVSMAGGLPIDWYNRYAGFSNTLGKAEENGAVAVSLLGIYPWFSVDWNTQNHQMLPKTHEFGAQLLMEWRYDGSLDPEITTSQNRGSFGLSGFWLWNATLKVMGKLSMVYFPSGLGQDTPQFLMPFSLGMFWNWSHEPDATTGKGIQNGASPMAFFVEGGLESRPTAFYQLEAREAFVNFSAKELISHEEESNWFFRARTQFPLVAEDGFPSRFFQDLLLDVGLSYRQSAFGTTVLMGDYTGVLNTWTGLFPSLTQAQKRFSTELAVTLVLSNFLFRAGWNSQWLYYPGYEAPQKVFLFGGYDSPTHPWGSEFHAEFCFKGPDGLPVLNSRFYYNPAENLQLAISLKDMLKLFSGSQRVFVEPYVKEAGSVALSLQFNF